MEWPILSKFDISAYRPKLVIAEIQEKQARYRGNARVQADALSLERYFRDAGYSILYRDSACAALLSEAAPHRTTPPLLCSGQHCLHPQGRALRGRRLSTPEPRTPALRPL